MSQCILVVDGGRSHLRTVLVTEEGEILWRHEEPGLSSALGAWKELARRLAGVAETTLAEAETDPARLVQCAAGLAGLGRAEDCSAVESILAEVDPSRRWLIESDAAMTLRAAAVHGPVAIAILGTGSVFFARDLDEKVHRVGGWGALLDDWGSGFEIGRRGVQAVFRAWDGTGPATALSEVVLGRFACSEPPQLLVYLYREKLESSLWASIAPDVAACAEEGDEVASAILDSQYEGVAQSLRTLYEKAGLDDSIPLFLSGGMVQGIPAFQRGLAEVIHRKSPGLPVGLLEREPFWGGWERVRAGRR